MSKIPLFTKIKNTKGDLLQIHTNNSEVIIGRFYGMSNNMSTLSVYGVKDSSASRENVGIIHYYNSDVRDIVKLEDPIKETMLKITEKEYEELIKISKKFVYVNQVDHLFHEAINDLNQYSYVAVNADIQNISRRCKLPLLVMSTPNQIYIFDVQVMQDHAFDAGLKKILESDSPKKIIHDCRNLSDCLYHKHGVKLNSVFDTQIGDIIITKNKTNKLPSKVKSLSECLQAYLGLPNVFKDKLDILQCSERPLTRTIKETVAKNIAFLHYLSDTIKDQMMLPFVRGVEFYTENLRSCDDFVAWQLCGKHQQLPKEFQSTVDNITHA